MTVRALAICLLLGAAACSIDLSGAPCTNGTHCPRGQYCAADGRCQLGSTPAAVLEKLTLSPPTPAVPKGGSVQLIAVGAYSDGSTQELTSVVTWSSADDAIATVSNSTGSRGLVTALQRGPVTLTARLSGREGSTVVFVAEPALVSIALSPTQPSIAPNTTQQFVATGTYSDKTLQDVSSLVSWSSSAPGVASISNVAGSKGLASALGQGAVTITASLGSVAGTTLLLATSATVSSLSITPPNPTRARGTTQQFLATASFSDGSTQDVTSLVSWSSSATGIASISNAPGSRGLATTTTGGTTSISVTLGGSAASTVLTVTNASLTSIAVTPTHPSIANSTSLQLVATAIFSDATTQDVTSTATWQSLATAVASVSDAAGTKGQVMGASAGMATIRATASGVAGSTNVSVSGATLLSLAVTPSNPTFGKGTTQPFTATGSYSDNTTQDLTAATAWSSGDSAMVTVSNAASSKGVATGVAAGTTTVSATIGTVSASTPATVSGATLTSIAVTPSTLTLSKGSTYPFVASGTYSDGSVQDLTLLVTWSSSAAPVANVSNAIGSKGLVTTTAVGSTSITAALSSKAGTATLNVTAATLSTLTVSPPDSSVAKGSTRQFWVVGTYSDGSTQDLTAQVGWATSNSGIATISNAAGSKGLANAIIVGAATITATLGAITGSTQLTVTGATLVSIAVTPANATISSGGSQQFSATGTYSDTSTQSLTLQVTWASSNTSAVTISNAGGSKGRATGFGMGTTTISATLLTTTGQTSLTVSF